MLNRHPMHIVRRSSWVLALALAALLIALIPAHRAAAARSVRRAQSRHAIRVQPATALRPDLAVTTIVSSVFSSLATAAGKSLAQIIAQNEPALGWLLPASAQRELLHAQQLAEVNRSLDALSHQVKELHHQIALDAFTNLVAHTNGTTSMIKHAWDELEKLAAMPAASPQAAAAAVRLQRYIGANLLDAPAKLNGALAPSVPLASNLIESASRLVHQRDRFFGPKSSAAVASVYETFAGYQAQLAVLLQNYYHSLPDQYGPEAAPNYLRDQHEHLEAQRKSLKPAVPEDTVIDTGTNEMWTTNFPSGPNAPARVVPMQTIATLTIRHAVGFKYHYELLKPAGPTALGGLPFDNWRLPDVNRYKSLLSGRGAESPIDWLQHQAGFDRGFLQAGDDLKWTDETPHVNTILVVSSMDVRRFSLRTGEFDSVPVTWATQTDGWKHWFEHFSAGRIYYRPMPAGGKYWW